MTRRVKHNYPSTRKRWTFAPRRCDACTLMFDPTGPRQVNCAGCGHPSDKRAKMIKRLRGG